MRDQSTAKKPRTRSSGKLPAPVPATPDAFAPRSTPFIATGLRRGARVRRSVGQPPAQGGDQPQQQQQQGLPDEILRLVAGALAPAELSAASLVCRQWARSLRGAVASLEVHAPATEAACEAKVAAIASALPDLAALRVHYGARVEPLALGAFLRGLTRLRRLKELRLTSWVPHAPQRGASPLRGLALADFRGLAGLVLDGCTPPNDGEVPMLFPTASGLTAFDVGVDHTGLGAPLPPPTMSQLDRFAAPAWLQPGERAGGFTGRPRPRALTYAAHLRASCPALERVALALDAEQPDAALGELARLPKLVALDLTRGTCVPSDALAALSKCASLRELRFQPLWGELLEDHALLGLTQLRALGVRLVRRAAEPLVRDLSVLAARRPRAAAPLAALVDLELSRCIWSADAGAAAASLSALTRLRLDRLECVRPARASASASRAAMSVDLSPLASLRGMRVFELAAATGVFAGVLQGLGRLWAAWAPTLEDVRLVDLSPAELEPAATLPALGACGKLKTLWLLLREMALPADGAAVFISALPASLERLALRHVALAAGAGATERMTALASLSLRQCSVYAPAPKQEQQGQQEKKKQKKRPSASPSPAPSSASPSLSPPPTARPMRTRRSSAAAAAAAIAAGGSSPQQQQQQQRRHDEDEDAGDLLLKAAQGDNYAAHGRLLAALPALTSVELVSQSQLCDADFAAIGRLTALTALLVCASGNTAVSHAALQSLSGLSRLRQLRWHVGDVADLLPDVGALRALSGLVALHVPSYLHGQFARWSAYHALPPLADVHVEMPLP